MAHRLVDLEPHRVRAAPAAAEHALDRLEQVLRLVLLDLEVGVARQAERVVRDELHAREQPVQVRGDHGLERDEPLAVGERDEPREQRRHLHAREPAHARHRVAHHRREVEGQVRDVRERVRGVDRQRGQHREDALVELLLEEREVRRVQRLDRAHDPDPLLLERRHELGGEDVRRAGRQLLRALPDPLELLGGRPAVGRTLDHAGLDLLLQARDPDLEELVEVVREDRDELQPLEQGQRGVLGQREHAGVELEPRQLAVEVPSVVGEFGGRGSVRLPAPWTWGKGLSLRATERPRARAQSTNLYPSPRTVSRCSGWWGSSSSLRRRRFTCTSRVRVSPK